MHPASWSRRHGSLASSASAVSSSAAPATVAAHGVQRLVAHQAVNPTTADRRRRQSWQIWSDVHECVVQHVFGLLALTHDAQRHTNR
jgi:hypothetical protein